MWSWVENIGRWCWLLGPGYNSGSNLRDPFPKISCSASNQYAPFLSSALLPAHIYWWTESKCHRCKISCPNAICPNIQPYLVFDNDSNIIEVEHSSPYIHIPQLSVVLWCHNIPDRAGWSLANLVQCFQPDQIDNKSWKHAVALLCNVWWVTIAISKAESCPNESFISPRESLCAVLPSHLLHCSDFW